MDQDILIKLLPLILVSLIIIVLQIIKGINIKKENKVTNNKFIPTNDIKWSKEEEELFNRVNAYRSKHGAPNLIKESYHYLKAVDRVMYNFGNKTEISHDNFFATEAEMKEQGLNSAGENLGYGYYNAESMMKSWTKSTKGHKENMLKKGWIYTGISIMSDESDNGKKYYCQIFGK